MMTDSNLTAGEVALWEAMQGAPLPGPQTKEQLLDRISKKPPAYVLAYIASVVERGCFKAAVEFLRRQPTAITPDVTTARAPAARDAQQVQNLHEFAAPQDAMRPMLEHLFKLMDDADDALDKDTYEQLCRDEFDPPDDADYSVCAGTTIKCNKVFNQIEAIRRDFGAALASTPPKGGQ